MNREELKELGLTDEQIDSVMKSHGKTVNSIKEKADKVDGLEAQVEDYKNQLKDRDEQLEELSTKAKDNEELTAEIEKLKESNKNTAAEYQAKLDQQAFEFKLEKALADAKAKNPKAVKALLNVEEIKLDGDKLLGLEDQLKALQESDAYLFGEDAKLGGRDPHNPNPKPNPINNPFSKEHFNLTEQARILKDDPELAKTLKAQAKG